MSGVCTWVRIAGFTIWGLVVLAAFRSEPFVHGLIGDQYTVTHQWCGVWGCSASIPRLLAWQISTVLAMVPGAWLATRYIPWVTRNAGRIAAVVFVAILAWLVTYTIQSWSDNHLRNIADVARRVVFISVAGTSIVIPATLSGLAMLWGCLRRGSRSDADVRAQAKEAEDFRDVVVTHVDAPT